MSKGKQPEATRPMSPPAYRNEHKGACRCGGDLRLHYVQVQEPGRASAALGEAMGQRRPLEWWNDEMAPIRVVQYDCYDAPNGDIPGHRPGGCGARFILITSAVGRVLYRFGDPPIALW